MPKVNYGRMDEPSFELEESSDMIAVRMRAGETMLRGPVMGAEAMALDEAELMLSFASAGVEVYKMDMAASARSMDEIKTALRAEEGVRFAGSVLVDADSGEPVIYTENIFIKFSDDADMDAAQVMLRERGLKVKRELGFGANCLFLEAMEGTGQRVFEMAQELLRHDEVEYCHPELLRKREFKAIFPQQWHLQSTTVNGVGVNASANVAAAHAVTEGDGVTIAVIDDGFDLEHIEFQGAGKVVSPRETAFRLQLPDGRMEPRGLDPRPKSGGDNHGTACAGVACARGFAGASGVAPAARLIPIRSVQGLGSVAEAEAFQWAADQGADVISCSWGPADGNWSNPNDPLHSQKVQLPASTRMAIDYATSQGRGGKGCVVLFAAGNGNESVDNDGYASYAGVIAVAACNDRSVRSVYSDFGDAVFCAFPSSDFQFPAENRPRPLTRGIWTVDRSGNVGYNRGGNSSAGDAEGDYTDSFGGTSSSCPGAAGVAALVIARNPSLTGLEVRDILRRCCDRIDPQGGAYNAEGRSKLYGYGRLNAATAVELAAPKATTSQMMVGRTFNTPLPDVQTVEVSLAVGESAPVAGIEVEVELLHTYVGDLVLTLVAPARLGVPEIVLQSRQGGATRNLKKIFRGDEVPALEELRGKDVSGNWTLRIEDQAAQDEGTLVRFALVLTLES